ncbi:MAG: hypothetical protein KUG51_03650 [Urechidicola sp.]|nr:hypothetical protein [Urechidicola sp.]
MKNQFLGTFFYMLYMVAMLQPIMPLIEYQTNKEYIASVLCENRNKPELACNGKCYLNKKVKESHDEKHRDHSIPQIDLSKYPISLIDFTSSEFKKDEAYNTTQFLTPSEHLQRYSNSLFRPPIV